MPSRRQSVVRARERVAAVRGPLRRALEALAEVERLGALGDRNVFGRYRLDPGEDPDIIRDAVAFAQDEYSGQALEVIVVIAGDEDETQGP